MRVLIIAHGDPPSTELLKSLIADSELVIATDGAVNTLIPAGILPHVVLGDFDSLDTRIPSEHPEIEFVNAASQEASDLDKAIAYALERGAGRIRIAGAGGGRLDHTLANVSLLLKYRGSDISLIDDRGTTVAVDGEAVFDGQKRDILSLIPFDRTVIGWTEGLKWPLRDEELLPGTRGVSNEFVEPIARLRVESGIVIACHLRNPDTQRQTTADSRSVSVPESASSSARHPRGRVTGFGS